jgi:hypothetical protein
LEQMNESNQWTPKRLLVFPIPILKHNKHHVRATL